MGEGLSFLEGLVSLPLHENGEDLSIFFLLFYAFLLSQCWREVPSLKFNLVSYRLMSVPDASETVDLCCS